MSSHFQHPIRVCTQKVVVALRICKWVAMSPWFVMLEFVIKCNSESWCRWDLAMSTPSGLVNLLHDSLDLVNPKFSSYKTLGKNQAIIALVTHISWWFTSLLSPVSHFLIFMNLIIGHIVASSVSFTGNFCQISTWKIQFKPMQMRKKGPNLSDFKKIKSKFPEFLW
jgi:hypothetical protein